MNASTPLTSPVSIVPTASAERFGKTLLLINGIVLAGVAFVQAIFDLSGAFLDLGPTASALHLNPDAIGYFEAHALALLAAVVILAHRNAPHAGWHWFAAAVHLVLGAANLLFWTSFTSYGLTPMGIVATGMHAAFVALNLVAGLARTPWILGAPGATFRVASAITIVTGISLHMMRLPLGPERFVAEAFTPLADAIFAIPMTTAGLAGLLLWRRAILPARWEKLAYGFVVFFFLFSVIIHVRTIFTWDTSYTLLFPSWYPLAALIYLSIIGLFAVTRRFNPARNK
jgi:hypothetical protein